MAGIGIDGLSSGLDTTSLINQLMQVEANQQTLLAAKKSGASSVVTALQGLNTRLASLAESATAATKQSSWDAVKASSSSTSVTVSADATASVGTLRFSVGALATAQSSLVTLPEDMDADAPGIVLNIAGKDPVEISALSTDPRDIAAAVNAANAGVRATTVNVGTTEAPSYRLQLTASETGAANTFSVDVRTTSGTVAASLSEITAAADARITLFPGSTAEHEVTSSSNTFTGVLEGVTLTVSEVSKADATPVTINVSRDDAALAKLGTGLVNNLNVVLEEIASRTSSTTSEADDGGTLVKGGLLSGETFVRALSSELLMGASVYGDAGSLADIGITISRAGRFEIDAEKYDAALAKDASGVQELVTKLADAVGAVATRASDPTNGTITSRIQSGESTVRDLADRISAWDDRLATRRATLEKTYAALEVTLSKLNSSADWLTAQITQMYSNNQS